MSTGDFAVDLEALVAAAGRVGRTAELVRGPHLAALTPTAAALGNPELAVAMAEFRARWLEALAVLRRDAEEVSGRLSRVAMLYREFDDETARAFEALRPLGADAPGSDPGGDDPAVGDDRARR